MNTTDSIGSLTVKTPSTPTSTLARTSSSGISRTPRTPGTPGRTTSFRTRKHPAFNNIDLETIYSNTIFGRVKRLWGTGKNSKFYLPQHNNLGEITDAILTKKALDTLYENARKGEASSIKPLKRAENIERMLIQDPTLQDNLETAFPILKESKKNAYWTKFKGREALHRFIDETIRHKVSNLTIAKYITRELPDSGPQFFGNTQTNTLTNDEIFTIIKTKLIENAYVTEDFSIEDYNDLMNKFENLSAWFPANTAITQPERFGMRKLFPKEFVFLIVAIEDIKLKNIDKQDTTEEFKKKVLANLADSIERGKKFLKQKDIDNVNNIANYLNWEYIRQNAIPYELLFGGRPTHIANNQFGDFPFLHHAMYLTGNIVLEQFAQLPPVENRNQQFTTYVNLKYMYDYLKINRNTGSNIYIIPYKNPLPDDVIRSRALWTLGKYPNYSMFYENCESVQNWIFENITTFPTMCKKPYFWDVPSSTSSGLKKFWGTILTKAGYFILFPAAGGKSKTRKNNSFRQ